MVTFPYHNYYYFISSFNLCSRNRCIIFQSPTNLICHYVLCETWRYGLSLLCHWRTRLFRHFGNDSVRANNLTLIISCDYIESTVIVKILNETLEKKRKHERHSGNAVDRSLNGAIMKRQHTCAVISIFYCLTSILISKHLNVWWGVCKTHTCMYICIHNKWYTM